MENKGLLFIPDISGFTRFVTETEIGHSRLIIQELLELLINNNEIGLEVSEVEGDAILFYKFGDAPSLEAIYRQVEKMFCAFHRNLIIYDNRRYCQCQACVSASDLTLKVITHFGEFTGYNVKNFSKLIGKDVIVAHQLLKNDIPQHEYWLVTNSLADDRPPEGFAEWMQWMSSSRQTETGEIPFHYTQLSALKKQIEIEPIQLPDISKKEKVISLSADYDTDIITLFHATGDFNFRHLWLEGVKKVEEVAHYLPRVGMKCRCILENGESISYASSYQYSPDKIEFSETEEETGRLTYFTLETIRDKRTRLVLDYYIDGNIFSKEWFKITQKNKLETKFKKSLVNLETLAKEIILPDV
ncbi:MAG TPA: DUF2652 domain-containing protein [Chitinophagaceae bacterium]